MTFTQLAPAALKRPARPRSPLAERSRWDGPRRTAVLTAVCSAVAAVVLSQTVFSRLSINNDEAVYLLQAKALAGGHLFPPAGHPAASFTPWLGVVAGDHYVLKYTPVVAAFLALSIVLTGSYVAALALWAAGFVLATFALAKEVTGNRTTAAIASVVAALCPLAVVQSALALPYLPFTVLAELTLWGLLAGVRRGRVRPLLTAGFCAGLAFAARPFDALLFLLPTAAWALWRARRRWRMTIAGLLAGLAAPAGALLWFDQAATGSALRLPFSLFDSGDTLGFGVHRLYPGDPPRHFGISQGWEGLWRHLSLLGGGWAFGGILLAALASYALARRRIPAAGLAVLAGGLLLTVGYLFFWGTWNAAVLWGGTRYVGPYYLTPLLVPLCILGAAGLHALAEVATWRAIAAGLAATAVSTVALVPVIGADAAFKADTVGLSKAIAAKGKSLVFVDTFPHYLQHPTPVDGNPPTPGGRTVYALQRGAADFAVLRNYPGRPVYLLRLLGAYGRHPHSGYGARLQRLQTLTGRALRVSITARIPRSMAFARLVVSTGRRQVTYPLLPGRKWPLVLTFSATAQAGPSSPLAFPAVDPAGEVNLTVFMQRNPRGKPHASHLLIPMRRNASGALTMLAPAGSATDLGPAPRPVLSVEMAWVSR